MIITGKNLLLVNEALDLADSELHNQIATCPDVDAYADDVAGYEKQRVELDRLRARVQRAIAKEKEMRGV